MGSTDIIVSCILVRLLAPTGAYEVTVVAKQVQDMDISSWIFMGLALVGSSLLYSASMQSFSY